MPADVALEAEEWYVLCNWLRERENRLMYALRSRSAEWERVHELRRSIETQRAADAETRATVERVRLTEQQFDYLERFLRRRSLALLVRPWRDRERREVKLLARQLRANRAGDGRAGDDPE